MKTIEVTAGVIERDGGVLLTRRGKNESFPGLWEFPGGKIEAGETREECLKRELKEELGIDAEIGKFLVESRHIYREFTVRLFVYRVSAFSGSLMLRNHDEAAWVVPEKLFSYSLLPADIPAAEALLNETEMK